MKGLTQAKGSEEYMRLLGYVLDRPPGYLLEYSTIQKDTGVLMDSHGKAKLRRAIIRSHREYSAIKNIGYKLADTDMVIGLLTFRLQRIDSQVRRADKAQVILQQEFYNQLKPEEQRGVLFIGSIFGAIRLAADNGRSLYAADRKQLESPQSVEIPDV